MRIFSRNFHKPWPRNPWPIAAPSAPTNSGPDQSDGAAAEQGEWPVSQAAASSAQRREEVTVSAAAIGAGAPAQ